MTKNIILAGVGGQGILTIAHIIDHVAMMNNLNIKQAEVHGMSQRGGAVQSHLRLSDQEIFSDLIPLGKADLLISLEPMETLRYVQYLAPGAVIISATRPIMNIDNYPDLEVLLGRIKQLGFNHLLVDVDALALEAGSIRTANVVMVGVAQQFIDIPVDDFKDAIRHLFATKGDRILDQNLKAFEMGTSVNLRS